MSPVPPVFHTEATVIKVAANTGFYLKEIEIRDQTTS